MRARFARIGVLFCTLLLALVTIGQSTVIHATPPPPVYDYPGNYPPASWWNGETCDATHYHDGNGDTAYLLATWKGLQACGYGPDQPGGGQDVLVDFPAPNLNDQYEWECTELVKRYLYLAFGLPALPGNGNTIVISYSTTYTTSTVAFVNDGANHGFPTVGDVLSYGLGENHTAIVIGITVTNAISGNATLSIFEQNLSMTGKSLQDMQGWKIKNGISNYTSNGDTVTGWLHPRRFKDISVANQSGITKTSITAMAALSTTNVLAVGYYYYPGVYAWVPYAAEYNGTSWTRRLPPRPQTQYSSYLNGATTNAAEGFAVGYYLAANSKRYTLAYYWNKTTHSWSQVTSANPSTSENYLSSVSEDAGGNVWAVGYTYQNGVGERLLMEQFVSGSGLIVPTGVPTTTTYSKLNSVSIQSSTNGWAAGQLWNTSTSKWNSLVYHWDGTSWTKDTGFPTNNVWSQVNSVVAVSDTEAWAVGIDYQDSSKPLLVHYDNGTWTKHTNISQFPSGATLNGVWGNSPNDIWATGYRWLSPTINNKFIPYILHWNGNSWVLQDVPTPSGQVPVFGGAALDGKAWFGGYVTPPSSSNINPLIEEYGH